METGGWFRETYYYDEHGRELQRIHDNGLGGISRVDRGYDFTGNVVKERESHGMADSRMDVLESSYSYDSRGRQTGISSGEFHELFSYESEAGGRPIRYNGNSAASLYIPEYDGLDR